MDFGILKEKIKPKQKVLAKCETYSKRQFTPVLFLAQPLGNI